MSPSLEKNDPFNVITDLRENFLVSKGPPIDRPISVKEAILDLATAHGKIPPVDSANFMHGTYAPSITQYQHLMRGNLGGTFLDSHRLANHRLETVSRFKDILTTCRRGVHLSVSDRKRFGLKKHSTVLSGSVPAFTHTNNTTR